MSTDATRKRGIGRWLMYGIGAVVVLGIIGAMTGDDNATPTASRPAADAPAGATDEPTPAPTDAPLAPAFGDIEAKRADATDLQWDDYVKTLEGTRADGWPGIVREVKAKGDDVEVSVDLTPGGGLMGMADAFIRTDDPAARAFAKDQPVVVGGTIEGVSSVLGSIVVRFENGATVTAAP